LLGGHNHFLLSEISYCRCRRVKEMICESDGTGWGLDKALSFKELAIPLPLYAEQRGLVKWKRRLPSLTGLKLPTAPNKCSTAYLRELSLDARLQQDRLR
jgi:hypothetical protein